MLSLGNTSIKDVYFGSTKIKEIYLGSSKVYSSVPASTFPYLIFEFSNSSFTPTTSLLNSSYRSICEWKQVSSSPNVWKLEIHQWLYDGQQNQSGVRILFSESDSSGVGNLVPNKLGSGTCKLIGSGNFNASLKVPGTYISYVCESFDRMFRYCTGLTSIVPIQCSNAVNVGGMYDNCTEIEGGALDQYNWFNTYGVNITNHSGTFTSCGSNTQTGLAELNQIPVGWGGNLVPASTLMTSSRTKNWGTYTTWQIIGYAPDWTNIIGLYLFTEASVSSYAGVSMNRSRITARNNLATGTSYALYFYPAFAQYTGSTSSNRTITWIATTDTPNGNLAAGQGNTDMPGTLDYSTFGPITREYGTYDSSENVYFLFLVTNVPIANWGGLTDPYGVLYNSNFNADAGLRYFF